MSDEEKPNRQHKRVMTPLGIIALFVSFSEALLGAAAAFTSGWLQATLVLFLIAYSLFVAGMFFRVLWMRPHVFYSPMEYGSATDVGAFVKAVGTNQAVSVDLFGELTRAVKTTVTSPDVVDELARGLESLRNKTANDVDAKAIADMLGVSADRASKIVLEAKFIRIDATALGGDEFLLAADHFSSVSDFLDTVYFKVEAIEAYTYTKKWVLRDAETKRVRSDLGGSRERGTGSTPDARSLPQAGVVPGMTLEAVPVGKSVRR